MRILITGGAGFIGSHLADRLLARGDEVVVIDNYATGRRDNLTPTDQLTVFEGSIVDPDLVQRAFESLPPDIVVHAAASYKDPNDWAEDSRTNALGSANVVEAAKRARAQRLIYFQTALCYGLHPLEQPITLQHPVQPAANSYALSKTAGERFVELSGLDYLSFRLANAYGPRNLTGPLPTFYHRLTNHMSYYVMDTRRDFIYVDDLVDAVMLAIDGQGQSGTYHIASGSDYAIKELFDATVKALGIEVPEVPVRPREPDDAFTILLDPSRTHRDFDWKVSTALEFGVEQTIAWYRQYGITQTYTHLNPVDIKD